MSDLRNLVSVVISVEENDKLIHEPLEEELKSALLATSKDSRPRHDDFGSGFYIAC